MPPVNLPPSIKDNSTRLIVWGWILTLAIPVAIVGFAAVQYVATATNTWGGTLQQVVNTIIFIIGAVGVFGFPAGIAMLFVGYSKRKKKAPPSQ